MTAPAPRGPQAPFYAATEALLGLTPGAPTQWWRLQAAVPTLPGAGSFRVRLTLRHPRFHRPRRLTVGIERLSRDGGPIGFGRLVAPRGWTALQADVERMRMAGWRIDPA